MSGVLSSLIFKKFHPAKLETSRRRVGPGDTHRSYNLSPRKEEEEKEKEKEQSPRHLIRALPGARKSRGHLVSARFHFRETEAGTVRINSCLNSYRRVLQRGPLCEQSGSCVMGGPNNADGVLEPMWISQALPSGPEAGRSWASRNKRPVAAA